jgi:methylthioribose-1-phosphate isomerase
MQLVIERNIMPLPQLARYADTVRYDAERGLVLALDWRAYPVETALVAYSDVEAIVQAIQSGAARHTAAAYLAGYGLALAAREWATRPSDARRGALIQAAELLRRADSNDARLSGLLDQALARADAATLAGEDAEAALLGVVQGEISRADRVAERCGRIAAGLLDEGDHVLTHGFAGPALIWMLHVALAEQAKPITLAVLAPPTPDDDTRLCAELARAIGLSVTLLDAPTTERDFEQAGAAVFFASAERIALDGGAAGGPGAARYAALARQHGLPCYVLGGDGPDPAVATFASQSDVMTPELISAIITSRGIYRPEMIARYLGDGDAPLDVIPLSLG